MTLSMSESIGECQLCGVETTPKEMTKHLAGCVEEYRYEVIGRDDAEPVSGYHLAFQAARAPMFWLHVLVRADATLAQLDSFLRDAWMEDRSTHSRFVIGTNVYSSEPTSTATPSNLQGDMSVTLREVVEADVPFEYSYALEASTEVEVRAIARRNVLPDRPETPVRLLARNQLPSIPCSCGGLAEFICPKCAEGPYGWICGECVDDHECFEGELEPARIENTPRALAKI